MIFRSSCCRVEAELQQLVEYRKDLELSGRRGMEPRSDPRVMGLRACRTPAEHHERRPNSHRTALPERDWSALSVRRGEHAAQGCNLLRLRATATWRHRRTPV